MNNGIKNSNVLVGSAVLCQDKESKESWFVIKNAGEETWEFPKVIVRKGESSVRAVLRIMGEKGSMTTRILEEVGRTDTVNTVNGKTVPQRVIYYLLILRSTPTEAIGFDNSDWLDYKKAIKTLSSKKEQSMLTSARDLYKLWKKERKAKGLSNSLEDEEEAIEEEAAAGEQ